MGIYSIVADICDWQPLCNTYTFTVVFANSAPVFSSTASSSITLHYGTATAFSIPSYSDPEGDPISITNYQDGLSALPSFVTFTSTVAYSFSPSTASDLGTYTIDSKICDGEPLCSVY